MLHHHSTRARLVSFHATQPQVRAQHHHVYPRVPQLRSNHTVMACFQGDLPGRPVPPPTGSSPWCPCPCVCCCCCQLLPMKQRRLSHRRYPHRRVSHFQMSALWGPFLLLVALADLRCRLFAPCFTTPLTFSRFDFSCPRRQAGRFV